MATPFDVQPFVKPFDIAGQKAEGAEYISGLTGAIQGQEKLGDMYSRVSGQVNLPSMREQGLRYGEQLGDLGSQIQALPQSIGPTQGAVMTEGQRQRAIASESQPLLEQYTTLGQQAGQLGERISSAESDVSRRMGMEVAQQEKELSPWEKSYDLLSTQQAREFSGYALENQMELDRLIQNMNAGIQLSEAEKNRAHELSMAEMGYQNALDRISASGEQARLTKKSPADLASLYRSFMGG